MSINGFRPLKWAQDYYYSLGTGFEWTSPNHAMPTLGSMCYLIVSHTSQKITTSHDPATRGYLGQDGWRLVRGEKVPEGYYVSLWKYDETNKGCNIL